MSDQGKTNAARWTFTALLPLQSALIALIAVHPERSKVADLFESYVERQLSELLNSRIPDADLGGFHGQVAALRAALHAQTPQPPA